MEKISSIIPQSARVQSVNLKESQTMRPGMPTFGAPSGKAAINGGDQPTTAEKAVAAHQTLMARRSGDAHKPELIKQMTDQFFMRNQSGPADMVEDVDVNFKMDRPRLDVIAPSEEFQIDGSEVVDEGQDEYVPPGSYIDVKV